MPAPGPFKRVQAGDHTIPLYMVPFDKRGGCRGPETRAALLADIRRGGYTHVFVCAHGWNNTFDEALTRYGNFLAGYHALEQAHDLPRPEPYRPVVVGLFWPSIDLNLPGEEPPRIAGTPPGRSAVADSDARAVAEWTADMPADRATELAGLAGKASLSPQEAADLAHLLAPGYPAEDDELDDHVPPMTAETILDIWADLRQAGLTSDRGRPAGPESFRVPPVDQPAATSATGPGAVWPAGPPAAGPQAAGRPGLRFDPRDILRACTVYKMKDRAGRVGAVGAGPLLRELLAADPAAHVHLSGHSYGCRLLLAALSTASLPRPADSLLLLQPAVNYLCFAGQVPKTGRPGGFRPALRQVRQPVLATFSARDRALHDLFHLAVRRRADLGEVKMAALGQVPSLYCALGGWGPGGLPDEARETVLASYPERYALGASPVRVYGVRSDTGIAGHSDVVNDFTFWALYNQVTA